MSRSFPQKTKTRREQTWRADDADVHRFFRVNPRDPRAIVIG